MKIVLASASPRRQDLLRQIGVDFEIMVSDVNEDIGERDPARLVQTLAYAKAKHAAAKLASDGCGKDTIVIGADTIVYIDGEVLGKPADEADAFLMLSRLSGRSHEVYTGLALLDAEGETVTVDRTVVYMRTLSDAEIKAYIASGEALGKAGAYGIQGRAAVFVERIEGDFFTVVGLPVYRLAELTNSAKPLKV